MTVWRKWNATLLRSLHHFKACENNRFAWNSILPYSCVILWDCDMQIWHKICGTSSVSSGKWEWSGSEQTVLGVDWKWPQHRRFQFAYRLISWSSASTLVVTVTVHFLRPDSVVGIATSRGAAWFCSLNPGMGKRFSFLQNCPDQIWDPFSLLFSGYRGSFPGETQPEREDGHSSLPSARDV